MDKRNEAISRSFGVAGREAAQEYADVGQEPAEALTSVQKPTGVDLEILEIGGSGGVLLPNRVRVNGQDVLVVADREIAINGLERSGEAVTVTLTMFVRSLVIKGE